MAHSTKAELKAQLKNTTEELKVLKKRSFLTEATHHADMSCLQKQLEELGEQEPWEGTFSFKAGQRKPHLRRCLMRKAYGGNTKESVKMNYSL